MTSIYTNFKVLFEIFDGANVDIGLDILVNITEKVASVIVESFAKGLGGDFNAVFFRKGNNASKHIKV